jgi:hypothetical protein
MVVLTLGNLFKLMKVGFTCDLGQHSILVRGYTQYAFHSFMLPNQALYFLSLAYFLFILNL